MISEVNTLGERFKYIRQSWHVTQAKMTVGLMSTSAYSKFERGESDINYDTYIKMSILTSYQYSELPIPKRKLEIANSKVPRNYTDSLSVLEDEIISAHQHLDQARLDELKPLVEQENNLWLNLCLKAAYAWIKKSNEDISQDDIAQVKKLVFMNKNMDSIAIHILGESVIMFDFDEVSPWVHKLYERYRNLLKLDYEYVKTPIDAMYTYAMIYLTLNYLNYCYIKKVDKKHVEAALEFIDSLSPMIRATTYKVLGVYYRALFDNDRKTVKEVQYILKKMGYEWLIINTIEN